MKKKANNKINYTDDINIMNFGKIIIILLIVLVAFSLLTMFMTRDKSDNNETVTIQYDKIIVGSILNRSEERYYVLVEYPDDTYISGYEGLINTYVSNPEHYRFYKVDLNDAFNKSYISDNANLNVTNITDIKFSETTLLRIKNGEIREAITGYDNITDYLTNLSA